MVGFRESPRRDPPPLFGREEVIAEADRLLSEVQTGHGQGLLVDGREGAGKSHVLTVIQEHAVRKGFRVLSGRGHLSDLPPPFSLIRELAASIDDLRSSSRLEGGLPPLASAPSMDHGAPEEAVTAGGRADGEARVDDLEQLLAPVIERDVGGREQLLGQIDGFLRNLARERPLLIVVDDLHLADSSSLEILSRLAVDLGGLPTGVVATVDRAADAPGSAWNAIDGLGRSPSFRSTTLRALTVSEVAELVRWITGGREPDPHLVLQWHSQTDGNPLFVSLLVRTMTGFRDTEASPSSDRPESLAEVLAARFEELDPRERRVLAHAAALGHEFDFAVLQSVTGSDEESVTESVDRLVRHGFLRERGREVYEFTSEPARARIYSDLTETHRRILHGKVGLALEAWGRAEEAELARHFYLGHDYERAFQHNLAAAETETRAFAFETAATHFARALEAERHRSARDIATEIRLLTEQGRLLTEAGSPHQAEAPLTEAVRLARSTQGHDVELARALLALGWARYERGEYESAEGLANEAQRLLAQAGTPRDEMAAHRLIGLACWRRGDLPLASTHLRVVLDLAEREGTAVEQGHALVDVANVIEPSDEANLQLALRFYDQAAALFAEANSPIALARVRMNRAVLEWEGGHTSAALTDFNLAIEAAERAHSARWIGWCQFNLAQMQADIGQTQLARAAVERASRVLEPIGDKTAEQQIWMARGMIDQADRAYDSAESDYQMSLKLAREQKAVSDSSEVLLRLALLAHDRGDDEAARTRLSEALQSGVLEYRPDFAPKVTKLREALGATTGAG